MTKLFSIEELTKDKITRAYAGKSGCMCGCLGNYKVNSKELIEHDESEFSPRAVTMRYNKVMNSDKKEIHYNVDKSILCIYVDDDIRNTVIYFQ